MEELLRQILEELREINRKLDDIRGEGPWCSMVDLHNKLDDIEIKLDDIEINMDND